MKNILISITIIMISLATKAQKFQGSIKSNTATKIDIVFKPTYTNVANEYIFLLQFTLAIPASNAGVTATAAGVNAFSYFSTQLTAATPYTEDHGTPGNTSDDEIIFTWIYGNVSFPSIFPIWTVNTDFTGIEVTFNTNVPCGVRMVDFTNIGCLKNDLAYFGVASTKKGDVTDYTNLFYSISGQSVLGIYPNNDQFVRTGPAVNCPANMTVYVNAAPFALSGATPTGGTYSKSGPGINAGVFDPALATAGTHTITYTYTDPSTACINSCTFTITVSLLPGAALAFDGSNDYVSVPHSSSLNLTTTATWEGWFKFNNLSNVQGMFNKGTGNYNTDGYYINMQADGGWIIYTQVGAPTDLYQAYTPINILTANQWVHIAIVKNGSIVNIYVNGVAQTITTGGPGAMPASIQPSTDNLYMGATRGAANGSIEQYFNGQRDEVRIWNRALTQCEILNNMNCEIQTNATGLVANYHFNQGIAGGTNTGITTLIDISGNSNDGTLNNFALSGLISNWVSPGGVTTGIYCSTFISPPAVTCPSNLSVCISAASFALSGATPTGGTYSKSGPGINAGVFDPALATAGAHTITYTYTDPSTACTNICTFTITVNALPAVTCPANLTVSCSTPPFLLTGGSPTGGIYSDGPGLVGGSFNPAAAGPGVHTITYTYTDPATTCTNSCTFTITVQGPLKAFLQGAFDAGLGRHRDNTLAWVTALDAGISTTTGTGGNPATYTNALIQPYNVKPFNYTGTEFVVSSYFTNSAFNPAFTDVVDWVLLELRTPAVGNTSTSMYPSNPLSSQAAFIREDGIIVDFSTLSPVSFPAPFWGGTYHLAIYHRNHLAIRTANPIKLGPAGEVCYDFTIAQSQAYQDPVITSYTNPNLINNAMVMVSPGVFAMWGGNANGMNTTGSGADMRKQYSQVRGSSSNIWKDMYFLNNLTIGTGGAKLTRYHPSDLNMDGTIDKAPASSLLTDLWFLKNTVLGGTLYKTISRHLK